MEKGEMMISSSSYSIMCWFRPEPLPSVIKYPLIAVGGTHLLSLFIDSVIAMKGQRELGITVPFVDTSFIRICPGWSEIRHHEVDLFLVVRRKQDADCAIRRLSPFPWRSFRVASAARLHAKVYTCVSENGAASALVGSHNLTAAAARDNNEAGVLLNTLRQSPITTVIEDLHSHSRQQFLQSSMRYDSCRWP